MHEYLDSASVLISFSGEVKISDVEHCRQEGDAGRMWASFGRLMVELMDKGKAPDEAPVLTRFDQWSPAAVDMFTTAVDEPSTKALMNHAFMSQRCQDELVWLVPFVMIAALHERR